MMTGGYPTRLIVAALATWRVAHLLAQEDGPAGVIARARERLGNGVAGQLLDCFQCLSFWVAAPAALYVTRRPADALATWLALSGAACLLERTGQPAVSIERLSEQPAKEETNGVLRTETRGGGQQVSEPADYNREYGGRDSIPQG